MLCGTLPQKRKNFKSYIFLNFSFLAHKNIKKNMIYIIYKYCNSKITQFFVHPVQHWKIFFSHHKVKFSLDWKNQNQHFYITKQFYILEYLMVLEHLENCGCFFSSMGTLQKTSRIIAQKGPKRYPINFKIFKIGDVRHFTLHLVWNDPYTRW